MPSKLSREETEAVVEALTDSIRSLCDQRTKVMDDFGRCGLWVDGHSYKKCSRLVGHDGDCWGP